MRLRIRAVDEETVAEAAAEGEVEAMASEQPVPVTAPKSACKLLLSGMGFVVKVVSYESNQTESTTPDTSCLARTFVPFITKLWSGVAVVK